LRLEECKEFEGKDKTTLSENLKTCPDIPNQKVFDKLEVIKDLKGVPCNTEKGCLFWFLDEGKPQMDFLTSVSYELSSNSELNFISSKSFEIYLEGELSYLVTYSNPPPNNEVFKIKLSEDQVYLLL